MENKQIDSKKLGKYFIDKMLDNTVNVFEQGYVTEKDIAAAFEKNNQLAGIMTFANLDTLNIFEKYSKELNKLAVDYYNNNEAHENFENFVHNCRKLHDEINNFISSK